MAFERHPHKAVNTEPTHHGAGHLPCAGALGRTPCALGLAKGRTGRGPQACPGVRCQAAAKEQPWRGGGVPAGRTPSTGWRLCPHAAEEPWGPAQLPMQANRCWVIPSSPRLPGTHSLPEPPGLPLRSARVRPRWPGGCPRLPPGTQAGRAVLQRRRGAGGRTSSP